MSSFNIRLTPNDINAMKDMLNFNGLSTKALQKYYKTVLYTRKRLFKLQKAGYIAREVVYSAKELGDNKRKISRVTNIYYLLYKGIRAINEHADPRYVVPKKESLDVANFVSNLYIRVPNLQSHRQARQKFKLTRNSYWPTCFIPSSPPLLIYIIGKNDKKHHLSRAIGFIKKHRSLGRHIIVSDKFEKNIFDLKNVYNVYFLFWDQALEIIENLAKDIDYYFKEFKTIIKKQLPHAIFYSQTTPPYWDVYVNGKTMKIAELISGSLFLREHLLNPISGVYVYAYEKSGNYLNSIKPKYGSYLIFFKRDQQVYRVELNPKTKQLKISNLESLF